MGAGKRAQMMNVIRRDILTRKQANLTKGLIGQFSRPEPLPGGL
jgi:hypothetical protein